MSLQRHYATILIDGDGKVRVIVSASITGQEAFFFLTFEMRREFFRIARKADGQKQVPEYGMNPNAH
jgi:hypothetical protein